MDSEGFFHLSRRALLMSGSATIAGAALHPAHGQSSSTGDAPSPGEPPTVDVRLTVNGQSRALTLDARTTLLDALREHLHVTGPKKGCDHGQCGACTVIVDGRRLNACLTLAAMQDGRDITTIEGLGTPEKMHPMQQAFVRHDGFQCGYCTPGQICSAVAVLDEMRAGMPSHVSDSLTVAPVLSREEIAERMSGNLCRCGAYSNIVEAIEDVARARA